jgi:hypothetical protein
MAPSCTLAAYSVVDGVVKGGEYDTGVHTGRLRRPQRRPRWWCSGRRAALRLPTPSTSAWSKVVKRTPGCTLAVYAVLPGMVQGGEEGAGLHPTPSSWAMSAVGVEGAKGCTPAASMPSSSWWPGE